MFKRQMTHLAREQVLEHMEANRRITLSSHNPSMKKSHQRAPITIDYLKLTENTITVNDVEVTFRSIITPKATQLPWELTSNNMNGGVNYDVNIYGHHDYNPYIHPSDIVFNYNEDHVRNMGEFQQNFRAVLNMKSTGVLNLERPEYGSYVECTYRVGNKITKRKLPEGLKIRDATRQYLANLFTSKVTINHLEINLDNSGDTKILRFPESVKPRVKKLTVKAELLEKLLTRIDTSCLPLKKLAIRTDNLGHKALKSDIVKTSESLEIIAPSARGWPDQLRALPQKEIEIITDDVSHISLIDMFENWKNDNKEFGFKMMIPCDDVKDKLDRVIKGAGLKEAGLLYDKHPKFPKIGTKVIEGNRRLNIYGTASTSKWTKHQFMIVLEVMELGNTFESCPVPRGRRYDRITNYRAGQLNFF